MVCNITGREYEYRFGNMKNVSEYFINTYHMNLFDIFELFTNNTILQNSFSFNVKEFFESKLKYITNDNNEFEESEDIYFDYKKDKSDFFCKFVVPLSKLSMEKQIERLKNEFDKDGFLYEVIGKREKETGYKGIESDFFGRKCDVYILKRVFDFDYIKNRYMELMLELYNINTVTNELNLKYQFDFSPIVVNYNSKSGKYELIDGYKRLFTNSQERINFNSIVKVYTDLTDSEYLKILNMCNGWKQSFSIKDYYDRGYLFSMKNRFGFTNEWIENQYGLSFKNILDEYNYNGMIPYYMDNECFTDDIMKLKECLLYNDFPIDKSNELSIMFIRHFCRFIGWQRHNGINKKIDILAMFIETVNNKDFIKFMTEKSKKVNSCQPAYLDTWSEKMINEIVRENKKILLN